MYSQRFLAMIYIVFTMGAIVDISDGQVQCVMNDLCSCTLSDGTGVIDISSLGNNDGFPLYADINGPDNYKYSLNLCYPFAEMACTNAAVCQMEADMSTSYSIGDSSLAAFEVDFLNKVHVKYTMPTEDGNIRTSDVTLVCDPNADPATLLVNGEQGAGSLIYAFTLNTKCACGNGCVSAPLPQPTTTTVETPKPDPEPHSTSDSGQGISTASVIYIVCIIILFLKVLFWSFVCYTRAQRRRQNGIFIVGNRRVVSPTRLINRTEERNNILHQEYLPRGFTNSAEQQAPNFPPSYNEVVSQSSGQFEKPPSYEQAVSNISNQGSTHTSAVSDIPENTLNNQ